MLSCIICPLEIVFPHNGFASSENGNVRRKRKLRTIINYLVKVNIGVCVQRGAFPPGAAVPQTGRQKQTEPIFYQQEAISGSNQPSTGFSCPWGVQAWGIPSLTKCCISSAFPGVSKGFISNNYLIANPPHFSKCSSCRGVPNCPVVMQRKNTEQVSLVW